MLHSRVHQDERRAARISHAIRAATSEDNRIEIDSTRINKLSDAPLPPIEQQVDFLLRWIATQVGDDHLGSADLPENLAELAGWVGTVDGDRVDDLVRLVRQEGLLETVPDNAVRLTLAGWRRLEALAHAKAAAGSLEARTKAAVEQENPTTAGISKVRTRKAHCPECGPERHADVVAEHTERWEDDDHPLFTIDHYRILRCRGCGTIYIEREHFFSEDEEVEVDPLTGEHEMVLRPKTMYWPSPFSRQTPNWLHEISDVGIRDMLEEVYAALNADLRSITAIGIRTVLEKTFELAGADPTAGFAAKIGHLEQQGVIGAHEKTILLAMTDAGSAAAHRGWRPEPEELKSILDATEGLLHRVIVLAAAAEKIRARVPPRPKRK
jgi:Domain of unknown function (DUF4145)